MLDAYTVRKAVPRILLAVIGVNLSIYLCVALVDITNIVGRGLMQLISAPFDFGKFDLDNGASNIGGLLGVLGGLVFGAIKLLGAGAGSGGLLGVMLLLILSIMLIALSILFTIAIRQTLIMLLILFSPIAIACMVLPGTEKYFKQWWDLFIKTLLVYPIIAALFAISGVMATLSFQNADSTGNIAASFQVITGLILIFLPLFMIPFAFKFSGGAIGSIISAANGMRGNAIAKERENLRRAAQDPYSTLGRFNQGINSTIGDARKRTFDRGVNMGNAGRRSGGVGGRVRRGVGATARLIGGTSSSARQAQRNQQSAQTLAAIAENGDDTYIRAATIPLGSLDGLRNTRRWRETTDAHGNVTGEQFQTSSGNWVNEGQIRAGHGLMKSKGDYQLAYKHVMSKAQNLDAEHQQWTLEDFTNYANEQGLSQGEAIGGWSGIAIPNQRMRADLRHSTFDGGRGNLQAQASHDGLLDMLGTEQGFSIASQQEGTFEAATVAYQQQYQQMQAYEAAGNLEQARIVKDRLHNFKGNLDKFVGAVGGGTVAAGDDGTANPATAYGGASSASYKTERAARTALATIVNMHQPNLNIPPPGAAGPIGPANPDYVGPEVGARPYSGGRDGDRETPIPHDPNIDNTTRR